MKLPRGYRYDYRIRLQVPSHTQDAYLLYYLSKIREPYWTHEYMVLTALRTHWLPFSYAARMQSEPSLTNHGLRQLVKISVAELQEQAKILQQHLLADIPSKKMDSN
jgi:hypothetical protein